MPQHAVFIKCKRDWLHQVTGYSLGYLCRVATGKVPLNSYFVERVAFATLQHPLELFAPEALNFLRQHQVKKRVPLLENLSGAKGR